MTHYVKVNTKIALMLSSVVFITLSSCSSSLGNNSEKCSKKSNVCSNEKDNHPDQVDLTDISVENITLDKLKSIKLEYQKRLDTGYAMYETELEQYTLLTRLKNDFIIKLRKESSTNSGRNNFEVKVNEWNLRVENAMNEQKKEFSNQGLDNDWGKDHEMMLLGAGVNQLYQILQELISFEKV